MAVPEGFKGLRFPCDCVSARGGGYSEPWAAVAKNKLLPNGTKEEILNLVAREPKTMSQVAEALKLSVPSVHTHVTEMLRSELLREATEWEKLHPAERYYEPNFPVIRQEEAAELCSLCQTLGEKVAEIFRKQRRQLEKAYARTPLSEKGWDFSHVAQYVFASVQRHARTMLEEEGLLSPPEEHSNGVEWVFWAEEPGEGE